MAKRKNNESTSAQMVEMAKTWVWREEEMQPHWGVARRFVASRNGDGYNVQQLPEDVEGGLWSAGVRCERIGIKYVSMVDAMKACSRTAGEGDAHHEWVKLVAA